MKNRRLMNLIASLLAIVMFFSCSDDVEIGNENNNAQGDVTIEITDSPIDDADVSAAVVTVSEVKIDGKSVEGFNKTTIDLLAYQNGRTKVLAEATTEAKSYSDITLVLDGETDENGSGPGCYVLTTDGTKHALLEGKTEIKADGNFNVEENMNKSLVIDFDLRKSIKRTEDNNDRYDFVSENELNTALRLALKAESNTIMGNCNNLGLQSADKIVVYAYAKGSYNREMETKKQGDSQLQFKQAISSATLDENGDFELHFLNNGEYELHFAAYDNDQAEGMTLKGTLIVDVLTSIDIAAISLESSSTINLSLLATGILPI